MINLKRYLVISALLPLVILFSPAFAIAQDSATLLVGAELARVVPPGFYFQGLSAPTQMRNSAAVRFGAKRYVIAGLVDTSGYAADVRARYEGFFITDSPVTINGSELSPGAFGFGFTDNGKMQILDLAGNQIVSVQMMKDPDLKRPRPLMMTKAVNGIRLYSGKDYVTIAAR